jgi:hypothetical protein
MILVSLMEEALSFFETSVLSRAARRNIPEDTILHSYRRENLKSYGLCLLQGHCEGVHIRTAGTNVEIPLCFLPHASKPLVSSLPACRGWGLVPTIGYVTLSTGQG